ncbi:transcriptional repressor LexA [Candidatus Palauibacter sp.]|uniref:transcriptional repressor LexA n=1 Tax=Candidatus Palauibacter sp. TaxID=3101350 RepID=UPI003B018F1A
MALTKRQREMLDFIEGFIRFRGYSPSFEEIAEDFGYRSLATVHEHLENLQAKGYIRKNYNESRSIELVEGKLRVAAVELTLYGSVAAGMPIEVAYDEETVAVPEDMISGSLSEHYVLRVRGDSMIDEQIRDGDYVIVQSRETAYNGEMVIALVDDESATMKKFYMEPGQIRLQPANPALTPLYLHPSRVKIQGVVIGVIRRY